VRALPKWDTGPIDTATTTVHARYVTLYWRVVVINAGVLVLASLTLALSPATVSDRLRLIEAIVLALGVAVLVLLNLILLRRTFGPLERLTALMRRVDPVAPGQRIPAAASSPEVDELGRAFNDMLDRLERERRDSSARALEAMESERLRIARELHDDVGQTLTALVLQLESLARCVPAEFREGVLESREAARATVEDIREIAHALRPEALDDFGLRAALATLGSSIADRTGLRVNTRLTGDLPPLDREHELAIYRVAQESLTNVLRHASATAVDLRLERCDGALVLRVRDDGVGADRSALAQRAAGGGSGLRGMRERALLMGGTLELAPARPSGTEVRLTVPLTEL
jgi:two-component system sensor histidine kinase UhpB